MSGVDLRNVVDVYRGHEGRVRALCTLILGDAAAAEDATQETFIRAAPHLTELRSEVVRSYLLSVARSVCADEVRLRQRRSRTVEALRGVTASADPEAVAVERRLLVAVWRHLAPREKLLMLHRFAGYSYEEIAHRLGMSTTAVGVALIRTRRKARRLLDEVRPLPALLLGAWRRRRRGGTAMAGGLRPLPAWPAAGRRARLAALLAAATALGAALVEGGAPQPLLPTGAVAAAPWRDLVNVDVQAWGAPPATSVYLTGYRLHGCAAALVCPVLLRSGDGGSSWQRLPAAGFEGGRVLAPVPAMGSRTLLGSGPRGLQRSDDGGATFRTVVAIPGPMAALRDPRTRRAGVLIASAPGWRYDVETGALSRGPALVAGTSTITDAATAPGFDHVLLAEQRVVGGAVVQEVARCDTMTCTTVWRVRDSGTLRLAAGLSGEIVVQAAHHVAFTVDGRQWQEEQVPPGAVVSSAVPGAAAGEVVMLVRRNGRAYLEMAAGRPPMPMPALASWMVVLRGGRILAGSHGAAQGAATEEVCSEDGGRSWQPLC